MQVRKGEMVRLRTLLLGFGVSLGAITATSLPLPAADLPAYMGVIVAGEPPAPAETAKQNVLALNTAMFGLYEDSGRIIGKNILAQHPVILALFNGGGGRFILYRPGAAPVEAPSVPGVYQLMKSVGHATMVIPVVAGCAAARWESVARAHFIASPVTFRASAVSDRIRRSAIVSTMTVMAWSTTK